VTKQFKYIFINPVLGLMLDLALDDSLDDPLFVLGRAPHGALA
jgi:hypothetical protein